MQKLKKSKVKNISIRDIPRPSHASLSIEAQNSRVKEVLETYSETYSDTD